MSKIAEARKITHAKITTLTVSCHLHQEDRSINPPEYKLASLQTNKQT